MLGDSLLLGVSTVRKGDIMSQNKHEPKESGNRTASSAAISGELSPDAAEGAESALESYVDVLLRDDVTQALPEHQRALGERLAKLSNYIREGQKLAYDLAEGKIEALDPSRFDSNNPLLLSLDEIKDNLSQSLTLASAFIADSDEKQPQEVSGNYILSLNAARSLRRSFRSAMVARWPTLNAATTVGRPRLMPTGKCTTTSLRKDSYVLDDLDNRVFEALSMASEGCYPLVYNVDTREKRDGQVRAVRVSRIPFGRLRRHAYDVRGLHHQSQCRRGDRSRYGPGELSRSCGCLGRNAHARLLGWAGCRES